MNYADHQRLVLAGEVKPLEGSCRRCKGWGYTEDEAPEIRPWRKRALGSGCPRCLGDGIDPEWAMAMGVHKENLILCDFGE